MGHGEYNVENWPVMECTVSKATIFGTERSAFEIRCSKWRGSLWWNRCFGTPLLRIPWIIDAWLPESENISQSIDKRAQTTRNVVKFKHFLH